MRDKKGRFGRFHGEKKYIKSRKSNKQLIKKILKTGVIKVPQEQASKLESTASSNFSRLKSLQDENFKELVLKNNIHYI